MKFQCLPALTLLAVSATVLLSASSARAYTVRTDRPRLLFGNGKGFGTTVAQFEARCASDEPMYKLRCNYMGGGKDNPAYVPAPTDSYSITAGMAAASILYAQPQRCVNAANWILANVPDNGPTSDTGDAHGFISPYGGAGVYMSIVRDWCDGALDASTKDQLETRIANHAHWMIDHYGKTGPSTEPADVFHDDYNNITSTIAFAGLALSGTGHDADAKVFLAYADDTWKKILIPAMVYSGDWWPEGFEYAQATLGGLAWYAAGWSTATDENIYDYLATSAGGLAANYLQFFTYALRPDDNYVYFGDTSPGKQSILFHQKWLVDMLNYGTGSGVGQGLSKHMWQSSLPAGFCSDVTCDMGWMVPMLYDTGKDAAIVDATTLPTARWLGKGSNDVAIMRSGWGKDDTYIMMSCGDYLGAHQHDEVGEFQIYRHSMLTGTTGVYESGGTGFNQPHWDNYYSQHSVHANTLAVYMPGERFPTSQVISGGPTQNVNDGGQRVLRRTMSLSGVIGAYTATDLPTYLKYKSSGPYNETGDIKTFEHAKCHDYVACDMTAAYDSPGFTTSDNAAKVKEVTRQLVFVRPEIVIVFDRVEALDASYEKRFLLHASGKGVVPVVAGKSITIDNGPGRLTAQTLLPTDAALGVIGNWTVEGKPYDPKADEPEMGGNRVEVVAKSAKTREYFLHVLDATDPSKTALVPAHVDDADDSATVTVNDGPNTYVVKFAKLGAMGGHIKVSGASNCEQDLGADAESPDAGPLGDGGGGDGAPAADTGTGPGSPDAAGDGSVAPGDASPDDSSGGCGCHLGPSDTARGEGALVTLMAIAGGVAVSRRRRSASRGKHDPR